MDEKNRQKFEELSRPLIKFLNETGHPHMTIIISTTHAELTEGICAFTTEDYILD